jgi:hypothetical protein
VSGKTECSEIKKTVEIMEKMYKKADPELLENTVDVP